MGHRYDDEAAPLCPLCGMAMVLVRIDPRVAAFSELHTYRCFSCGGVRADENWTIRIDSGEYSPWLGDSYANIASMGLSFQRSQNGGVVSTSSGPSGGASGTAISRALSCFPGVTTTAFIVLPAILFLPLLRHDSVKH